MRTVLKVLLVVLIGVVGFAVPATSEATLVIQITNATATDRMVQFSGNAIVLKIAGVLSLQGASVGRWHGLWEIECVVGPGCSANSWDAFLFDDQSGIGGIMTKTLPGFPANFFQFLCGGGAGNPNNPLGALIWGTGGAAALTGASGFTYRCAIGGGAIAVVFFFDGPGL